MTRYLLDTNHISPLVTLSHPLRHRIFTNISNEDAFCVATLCITEVLFGMGMLPRAIDNLKEWERLQERFTILSFQQIEAEQAARLQIALRRNGRQLGTVDAIIAVIALRDDLTLLTTDSDFDAIPDLKTSNWSKRS